MPNRLAQSLSPYLQQHKDNPVDWYPWADEALSRARVENRPIFLSIGYSSCHWCHVMEQESFSDTEIASVLNENFVCIKVDREERPDLDHIYMTALQMMSGQGGWPLNIFLTPDLRPFFGGTYFAPEARYGRPAFKDLLEKIIFAFKTQSDLVKKNSDQLVGLIAQQGQFFERRDKVDESLVEVVLKNLKKSYDPKGGGLGGAPKFFHTDGLRILLQQSVEQKDSELEKMSTHSLTQMGLGGVYDHLGGGFHRYSTDAFWQIPHFEKMLYDNALLSVVYLEAFEITKNHFFRNIVNETLDWVLREMKSKTGSFYSAIDADSEHIEGKFYRWTREEVSEALPAENREAFLARYGFSGAPNFEHYFVPHLKEPLDESEKLRFAAATKVLLALRNKRVWPLIDRKILTSWNGLMISALSRAGLSLDRADFLNAARAAADSIWTVSFKELRLRHSSFEGQSGSESFLEDYAYFGEGLLDLFEATQDSKYLDRAKSLAEGMMNHFYDDENAGFWSTLPQREDVLVRYKEIFDGATPAPYHLALSILVRLWAITGESAWAEAAEKSICAILGTALESPGGFHRFALVVDRFTKIRGGASKFVVCDDGSCREVKI